LASAGTRNIRRSVALGHHWESLNTLFKYPEDIQGAIYTTNAIESLNSVIHKTIKKRKLFPTDASATKVIHLAIMDAS